MIFFLILVASIVLILFLKRRQSSRATEMPATRASALDVAREYIESIELEEPDDEEPWPDQEQWDNSMRPDYREMSFVWSLLVHAVLNIKTIDNDSSETELSNDHEAQRKEIASLGSKFLTRVVSEEEKPQERSNYQNLSTECMAFLRQTKGAEWLFEQLEPVYKRLHKVSNSKPVSIENIIAEQQKRKAKSPDSRVECDKLDTALDLISKTNPKTIEKFLKLVSGSPNSSARVTIIAQINAAYRNNLGNQWELIYLIEEGTPVLHQEMEISLVRLASMRDIAEALEDRLREDGYTCEDKYTPYLPFNYNGYFSEHFCFDGNEFKTLREPSYDWWEAYCLDFSYETLLISINYDGIEIAFDANGSEFESFKTKLRDSQE